MISTILLMIGIICVISAIAVGFVAAPAELSVWNKLVWLRNAETGQNYRSLRLVTLAAGGASLLGSRGFALEESHPGGFSGWLMDKYSAPTPSDLTFALLVPFACLLYFYIMTISDKWSDLDDRSRKRIILWSIAKIIVITPILSIPTLPLLMLIQRSDGI